MAIIFITNESTIDAIICGIRHRPNVHRESAGTSEYAGPNYHTQIGRNAKNFAFDFGLQRF